MEQQPKLDPLTETALRSLKDIALPPPVSIMPQTWGWLLVAVLLAAAALTWAVVAYRRWQRNAYRREALKRLAVIETAIGNPQGQAEAAEALCELVKRTALSAWPRAQVAGLSGAEWAKFVAAHGDGAGERLKVLFDDLEYRQQTPLDADAAGDLVLDTRRWIEEHHVSA
ncbi:UNVERIFIED_ORG: hypothetical protein GGI57_001530 [Rhizobium aethiopicum]